MSEIVTSVCRRVLFRKPENGWAIIKTDAGICKGEIPFEPKDGDRLKMEGVWTESKFNGDKEFKFKTCLLAIPEDSRALLRYACELTKGIGPALEESIWTAYGDKWQEHPDLDGVAKVRADTISFWRETLRRLHDQNQQAQAIAYLLSQGATLNMANAAWEMWKESTCSVVMADCYKLADLPRYGFLDVENGIRQKFGVEDTDPRRMDSATLYSMGLVSAKVGTRVSRQEVVADLMRFVPDCIASVDDCFKRLQEAGKIVVLDGTWMALKCDHDAEAKVWERFQ